MYATKIICMLQKIYMCNKNYIYATKKYNICARKIIYMLQKIYIATKINMKEKYICKDFR